MATTLGSNLGLDCFPDSGEPLRNPEVGPFDKHRRFSHMFATFAAFVRMFSGSNLA